MTKKILCVLIALLVLAAPQARANEKVTIAQFGQEKILLYLPLYVAMEEGLFAKRGIDIDLKFAGNDDQVFAAVVGGSADFGVGDPAFVAIAKERKGPGKVVALLVSKLGLSGYTNKNIEPITDIKKLDGLRVSSFPQPSTTYTLLFEMKRAAAPKMHVVSVAFGAEMAALAGKQVDLAVSLEPTASIAEDKGYKIIFDVEKFTDPQAITGLTTTEDVIAKNPEMVQKVVSAVNEAMNVLHTQPDVAQRVAKKLFPNLKESVVTAAINRILAKNIYPETVVITDEYWQRTLKTRIDSGELKAAQALGVAVDNRFAEKAVLDLAAQKKK